MDHGNSLVAVSPLTEVEIEEVRHRYPDLKYRTQNGAGQWDGTLNFNREYNNYPIKDSYEISLGVPKGYPDELPIVIETGGRIKAIGELRKDQLSSILDLHCYPNGIVCLGTPDEIRDRFPIGAPFYAFVSDMVEPYFYAMTHFERTGSWPWGERGHGFLGLLESYADKKMGSEKEEVAKTIVALRKQPEWKEIGKYLRKEKPTRPCLCKNSNGNFQKCHPEAWKGLLRLQSDVSLYKLDIYHC